MCVVLFCYSSKPGQDGTASAPWEKKEKALFYYSLISFHPGTIIL